MTAIAPDASAAPPVSAPWRHAVEDALTVTWRNVTAMKRVPQVIVFSTIQPIIFVLMFRYVFGGAIAVPGVAYIDFLMPGVFLQTITFGATNTAVGLADDLQTGLIGRFRSLPMARSAVLTGRTMADLTRNVMVIQLMLLVGFLLGFRVHTNIAALIAAMAIMALFSFALSWMFAVVGLIAPTSEAAQAASFPVLAPLVFASSAFVPVATMPGWLQPFARNQPVSSTIDAVRALVLGGPTTGDVVQAIAWSVALVAIFAPIAVRLYRRSV